MQANLFIWGEKKDVRDREMSDRRSQTWADYRVGDASARCYPKGPDGVTDRFHCRPPESGHEMASLCQSCVHVAPSHDMTNSSLLHL
jgi:hypothetical protein